MTRKGAALPVFLAFLAMGFGDAVGPFVGLARDKFHLTNFVAQLIPFVGFAMFGLLSIPMGVYQDRKGKKFILLLGLLVMLAGILIPAVMGLSTFPVFLVTILLLGAGATTLQVAGNPIMRDVSPEGKYARNLSLGQFVKAIGSLSGPLIPAIAARVAGASWNVIFPIYAVALVITLIAVGTLKFQEQKAPDHKPTTFSSALGLLKNGYVAMMVLGLFLYVGAEVSVSSGIPLYLEDRFHLDVTRFGLLGTGLFFLALTIGRFSGGVILNWLNEHIFFLVTCAVAVLGLLCMFSPVKAAAVAGFFIIGFGFANIFPLIFAITVESMPQEANALSGLMVTAIVGGAILPPVMGFVADRLHSTQLAFFVPLAAILYICVVAIASRKSRPQVAAV
ncbi:MAG TPA: MFS transporter [Terriglobales bacterium]|nr:MFS transporter [Terriglobales bacterium]